MKKFPLVFIFICFLFLFNIGQAMEKTDTLLYSNPTSSSSLRISIILHHKRIPFSIFDVDLESMSKDDFISINPQQKIPVLFIDNHAIKQTMAISEYLEETRPNIAMLPIDLYKRSIIRQICMLIACDVQPLQNLALIDHLPEDMQKSWPKYWIEKGFMALEKIISDFSGPYAIGDQFTLADAFIYPQLLNAKRFEVDMSPYPHLLQLEKNLATQPAIIEALEIKHEK